MNIDWTYLCGMMRDAVASVDGYVRLKRLTDDLRWSAEDYDFADDASECLASFLSGYLQETSRDQATAKIADFLNCAQEQGFSFRRSGLVSIFEDDCIRELQLKFQRKLIDRYTAVSLIAKIWPMLELSYEEIGQEFPWLNSPKSG